MAMNKVEREAFEALRVRCALAWPPAPPAPINVQDELAAVSASTGARRFRAWWMNAARDLSSCVGEGVCEGNGHANEPYSDEQLENRYRGGSHTSFSQGAGGPWYRSKLDALRAYHHARAARFAKELAQIEARIEQGAQP